MKQMTDGMICYLIAVWAGFGVLGGFLKDGAVVARSLYVDLRRNRN